MIEMDMDPDRQPLYVDPDPAKRSQLKTLVLLMIF
jgi:hypothetical protein